MDSLTKSSSPAPLPGKSGGPIHRPRSLVSRLLVLFSCLVAIPLIFAGALLTLAARNSVRNTGDQMARMSQKAYRSSAQQLIEQASKSARESSDRLLDISNRQLSELGSSQRALGQKALQESGKLMQAQATKTMQSSADRLVNSNREVLRRSNERLRELHLEAIQRVSATLSFQAKSALINSGRQMAEQNRRSILEMVTQLNLERARRIAERSAQFMAQEWMVLAGAGQGLGGELSKGPSGKLRDTFDQRPVREDFLQLALVDPSGTVVEAFPELRGDPFFAKKQSVRGLRAFSEALRGNAQGMPAQFSEDGEPFVLLGVPVSDPSTGRQGVLFGHLRLRRLQALVEGTLLDEKTPSPAFLATPSGVILAHTDTSMVGRRIPPADGAVITAVGRSEAGTLQYGAREKDQTLAAYCRLPVPDRLRWFVCALQPLEPVMRGARQAEEQAVKVASLAARDMDAQARKEATRIVVQSAPEQERSTAEAARRIRLENQRLMEAAADKMRKEQNSITQRAMLVARERSEDTSEKALAVMSGHVTGALKESDKQLRERSARSAEEGMRQMGALATGAADRSATRMLVHSGWLLAFFVVLALVVATVTARSLVRPISQLAAGTEAIAQGDFTRRVPVSANDELGRLALAFNEMAAGIERSRYELECSNRVLEQEKSLIQAIVESSPDGMVLLDSSDDIVFLNPAAVKLLSPAPLGESDVPVSNRLLRQQVDLCLEAYSRDGVLNDVVLPGPPRTILQIGFIPVSSASGTSYGRLLHLRDVTREREIDEMKTNLISVVSHELRTPLTSILGFSSYMLTGKLGNLTDGQKTGLESMHRQANRLKAIISDFLDVSRIESGQVKMRQEPVRLAEVAARVLEDLKHQANEKRISLRMDGVDITRPAVALGDEERITQVFTNLLGNAIKFTEPGGSVTVRVSTTPDGVEASVRDSGVGIADEELGRIFDRFYQVEKVVSRKSGGTGLGLAIVKNIVEAHGGSLSVDSVVGSGTTFTFRLPAADDGQTPA
ncbi:MAG TPA: ATP-binding protein [Armatimonadota bacterium]|jgi:signal transduction histidine kinase/HAMP domain-containing protein